MQASDACGSGFMILLQKLLKHPARRLAFLAIHVNILYGFNPLLRLSSSLLRARAGHGGHPGSREVGECQAQAVSPGSLPPDTCWMRARGSHRPCHTEQPRLLGHCSLLGLVACIAGAVFLPRACCGVGNGSVSPGQISGLAKRGVGTMAEGCAILAVFDGRFWIWRK